MVQTGAPLGSRKRGALLGREYRSFEENMQVKCNEIVSFSALQDCGSVYGKTREDGSQLGVAQGRRSLQPSDEGLSLGTPGGRVKTKNVGSRRRISAFAAAL